MKPLSVRLFLPKSATAHSQKLLFLIYIHGGDFTLNSTFSLQYHNYVNTLAAEAKAITVSIEYRLAPEHALLWTRSGSMLNDYADFDRIFIVGDSIGANIVHHMAIQTGINDIKILGIILVHPFFANDEASYWCGDGLGANHDSGETVVVRMLVMVMAVMEETMLLSVQVMVLGAMMAVILLEAVVFIKVGVVTDYLFDYDH
ncbi:probable carboxylesterase 12 [Olea europaea var. sylvestris]|uniref:probable carboxylesterase 12 n=1 Tax=Olea europaea var. sylvestris TaxID=158386 RepID=UPI000C1D67C8|nr:probable carboxylesterase 12 [Olea europaea var. sylvestris]